MREQLQMVVNAQIAGNRAVEYVCESGSRGNEWRLQLLAPSLLPSSLDNEAGKSFTVDHPSPIVRMIIFNENPETIKRGLRVLYEWCQKNHLKVNTRKSQVMKFRKHGKLSRRDSNFSYGETNLDLVNRYEYLGIILQPSLTFTEHVKKRRASAMATIGALVKLHLTSLEVGLRIFDMKIKPMVTYGLDSISEFLTCKQLTILDQAKSRFLKRLLRVSKFTSSTLCHRLCNTPSLSTQLKDKGMNFNPEAWREYVEYREEREDHFRSKVMVPEFLKSNRSIFLYLTRRNFPRQRLSLAEYSDVLAKSFSHVLTLMRGPPGCGKTRLARRIKSLRSGQTSLISADDFFVSDDGVYTFQLEAKRKAHEWAICQASEVVISRGPHLIIDNTNMRVKEFLRFLRMGVECGYEVELVEPCAPDWNPSRLSRISVHEVSAEKIARMIQLFESLTHEGLDRLLQIEERMLERRILLEQGSKWLGNMERKMSRREFAIERSKVEAEVEKLLKEHETEEAFRQNQALILKRESNEYRTLTNEQLFLAQDSDVQRSENNSNVFPFVPRLFRGWTKEVSTGKEADSTWKSCMLLALADLRAMPTYTYDGLLDAPMGLVGHADGPLIIPQKVLTNPYLAVLDCFRRLPSWEWELRQGQLLGGSQTQTFSSVPADPWVLQ
ncbi:unnamed protein product [Cyprideis torosa]|uniref:Uncharacterized protein n=1 Tax=Cyprideis torosa TaxID=163714 RepID=A0A7R8ZV26_9CRUS|nr:unnamed protein product [Cyprideis torosa]CAG0901628.1 unnamed protein product [Cyprideis torosa]